MKRLAALLLSLPSVAMAHPGDHSGLGLRHLLTEPDHLVMFAAVVAVIALVIAKIRPRQ